jgi:hypothetical protein
VGAKDPQPSTVHGNNNIFAIREVVIVDQMQTLIIDVEFFQTCLQSMKGSCDVGDVRFI